MFGKGCRCLRRSLALIVLFAALVGVFTLPAAAHETKAVGPNGEYLISFGFINEPIYTQERNGLDIIVRHAEDRSPISHLEGTMIATIISPDGTVSRELPLRGVGRGRPLHGRCRVDRAGLLPSAAARIHFRFGI